MDVFISYSSHDKVAADATCAILEGDGIPCWIAPRDVLAGENWDEAIIDAIRSCKVFVLILSDNSNNSKHVANELQVATSSGLIVIPLRIADVPPSKALELHLSRTHWLDAINPPLERHIRKLSENIAGLLENSHLENRKVDVAGRARATRGKKSSWRLTMSLFAIVVLVFGIIILPTELAEQAAHSSTAQAIEISRSQRRSGDFDSAIDTIDKALSKAKPENKNLLYVERARSNYFRCKYQEAIADCDTVIASVPNTNAPELVVAWSLRGWSIYELTSDLDQCFADCDAAVRSCPKSSDALAFRSFAFAHQMKHGAAEKDAAQAVQLDSSSYLGHLALASSNENHGQFDIAQEHLDEALRLAPESAEVRYCQALLFARQSKFNLAALEATAALQSMPNYFRARLLRACVNIRMAKDEEAKSDLEWCDAVELPAHAIYDKVLCYYRMGNTEKAKALAHEAVGISKPTWQAFTAMALCQLTGYIGDGTYPSGTALDYANKGVQLSNNSPESLTVRAWIYLDMNEATKAIADCNAIEEWGRKTADSALVRAAALGQLGKTKAAQVAFSKAAEEFSDDGAILYSWCAYLHGIEEYESALEIANRYTDVLPNDPDAWDWKGYCHAELGEWEMAIGAYDQCLEKSPSNRPAILAQKSYVLHEQELYDKAIENLELALREEDDHPLWIYLKKSAVFRRTREFPSQDERETIYRNLIQDIDSILDEDNQTDSIKNDASCLRAFLQLRSNIHLDLKEYDFSITDAEAAIKINPSHHESYMLRGHALLEKGGRENAYNAIDDFTFAIGHAGSSNDKKLASMHAARGDAYFELDTLASYQKSFEDYSKAASLCPENPLYLRNASLVSALYGKEDYKAKIKRLDASIEQLQLATDDVARSDLASVYRVKAKLLSAREMHDAAVASLRRALKCTPGDRGLRGDLYDVIIESAKVNGFDKAIESVTSTIESQKAQAAEKLDIEYVARSRMYAEKSLFDKAVEDVNEAILITPDEKAYLYWRGRYLVSLKDATPENYRSAIKDLESCHSDKQLTVSQLAENFFWCGQAYGALGDFEKSLNYLDKSIDLEADKPAPAALYYKAFFRLRRNSSPNDLVAAVQLLSEAILQAKKMDSHKNLDLAEYYSLRARAYEWQGTLNLAIDDLDQVIRVSPSFDYARQRRGALAIKRGLSRPNLKDAKRDYAEGIDFLTREIEDRETFEGYAAKDQHDTYQWRGYANYLLGEHHQAIRDLTEAIGKIPNQAQTYELRSQSHQALKEYDAAIKDLSKAHELGPNDHLFHHRRGILLVLRGNGSDDLEKAVEDLSLALKDQESEDRCDSLYWRSTAYEALGKSEHAKQDLESAKKTNSKKVEQLMKQHTQHIAESE